MIASYLTMEYNREQKAMIQTMVIAEFLRINWRSVLKNPIFISNFLFLFYLIFYLNLFLLRTNKEDGENVLFEKMLFIIKEMMEERTPVNRKTTKKKSMVLE